MKVTSYNYYWLLKK